MGSDYMMDLQMGKRIGPYSGPRIAGSQVHHHGGNDV